VCVTTFKDEIVAVGGYAGGMDYLSTVEILNWEGGGRWLKLPDMTYKRSGPGVAVGPDGCIYVVGGSPDGLLGHTSFERLDLREGKWQKLKDMNFGRGYTAACWGRGNSFFVSGGLKADGPGQQSMFQQTMECYDPRANKWTTLVVKPPNDVGTITDIQTIVPETVVAAAGALAPTAVPVPVPPMPIAEFVTDHYNLDSASEDDSDSNNGTGNSHSNGYVDIEDEVDIYYGGASDHDTEDGDDDDGDDAQGNHFELEFSNDDEDESDEDDDVHVVDDQAIDPPPAFLINTDASSERQRSRLLSRAGHQMMFIY
jgi:hypothetical protein